VRTSRVGIHRLRALAQGRQEVVVALESRDIAGSEIFVGFALTPLPFARPEPSLLGVDLAIGYLAEQIAAPSTVWSGRRSTSSWRSALVIESG
jgi:hypothetical protein